MEDYDSTADTLEHIIQVYRNINRFCFELTVRGECHDLSKLRSPEKEIFDEFTPKLKDVEYGSEEYYNILKKMKSAVKHHQRNNRHHPEFYGDYGVEGMTLIDIVEMFCDWKASSMRSKDGNIMKSIDIGEKRHNIPPVLVRIFKNTAIALWPHTAKQDREFEILPNSEE
jgi:hypothetical protein